MRELDGVIPGDEDPVGRHAPPRQQRGSAQRLTHGDEVDAREHRACPSGQRWVLEGSEALSEHRGGDPQIRRALQHVQRPVGLHAIDVGHIPAPGRHHEVRLIDRGGAPTPWRDPARGLRCRQTRARHLCGSPAANDARRLAHERARAAAHAERRTQPPRGRRAWPADRTSRPLQMAAAAEGDRLGAAGRPAAFWARR